MQNVLLLNNFVFFVSYN